MKLNKYSKNITQDESVQSVLEYLQNQGYIV